MRSRLVHPGLFENEVLGKLDPNCVILFVGLSCYCDREGLFEWRPERIAARLFPYRKVDIKKLLDSLLAAGFLEKRGLIGSIPTFLTHQRPHVRETASKLLETFEGLPKNNPDMPRANLGEPAIDIDIEIEIETLKEEGSVRETNPQEIPTAPGCTFFRMDSNGEYLAMEWYRKNGFDPSLVPHATQIVEQWLSSGHTSAARQARKSKDHHKQLYAAWVLEKLSKVELARRQLNGHPHQKQKLTPAQEMLRLAAEQEANENR